MPESLRQWARERGLATASTDADFAPYAADPIAFVREVLGGEPWGRQRAVLEAVRDHPRVSVRSCHAAGKTWTAAAAGVWFLYTHPSSVLVTTAPTWRQVKELLWREIRSHHRRARLPGECLQTALELDTEWYAIGLSTDEPDKFQGFHGVDLMLIVDEAAGVSQEIFDAAEGILSTAGARVLLIGNPTSGSGQFHDTHKAKRGSWHALHISAFDTPAFTGEAVSEQVARQLVAREWVEGRRTEWGEESPLYQARVLGEFPDQAEDSLIALSWIEAAAEREPDAEGPVEMGVDVARKGGCETAVYVRQGPRVLHHDAWRGADLMETTGKVAALAREHGASLIRVDATGMGAGVADRLRELGLTVEAVIVGQAPKDRERFALLRDELWWSLRERLRDGDLGPLPDAVTQAQLSAIKYGYTSRGQVKVESKDDLSKRGLPSPDRADALALAFMAAAPPVEIWAL